MNTKKLGILAGILALMIIGIFISENISGKKSGSVRKDFFPGFKTTDCSRFIIKDKSGDVVTLFKEKDIWMVSQGAKTNDNENQSSIIEKSDGSTNSIVEAFKADSAQVVSALEKLSAIKMGDIISTNKEKQAIFELDSTKGTFVQIYGKSDKYIGTLVIGKSGTTWSENYVRLIDSKDVYSVPGTIRYSFFTEFKKWRDKTIIKLDPSQINKVELSSKEKGAVTLEKSTDSTGAQIWNITAPEKLSADNKAVTDLITSIATLKTYDWENSDTLSESDMGLDQPDITLKFSLNSGIEKIINFGRKWESSSKRWLTSTDFDNIFIVWQSNFDKANKSMDDLMQKVEEENN